MAAGTAVIVAVPSQVPGGRPASGTDAAPPRYLDGPPPGHTGGFGEPTCHECHFDNPPADTVGGFRVVGFPERAVPGGVYTLEVELARPEMERAGFQLAIRRDSGPRRGRPAGRLSGPSSRVRVVPGEASGVPYAQHTGTGVRVDGASRTSWTLRWRAPAACGVVALHAAGNAANGDDSEFGDHVYALRLETRVACAPTGGGRSAGGGS